MIAIASFFSVVGGVTLAGLAHRYPTYVEAIETGAGVLMIGGLALLGAGLPVA